MGAIEQMMTERAEQIEEITGGTAIVHCEMYNGCRGGYFSWYGAVRGGDMDGLTGLSRSFSDLKNVMQRKCDEKRAILAKEIVARAEAERSAQLYDVIYAGG